MDFQSLSEDLLACYESQLRATMEMTQRMLRMIEEARRGRQAVPRAGVGQAAIKQATAVAPVDVTEAAPVAVKGPVDGAPRMGWVHLQRPIERARMAVPEAVAQIDGIFTLGDIKDVRNPGCSDGVINKVLQEMIDRGELECVVRGSGRGGTKYRRPGTGLKAGSPLPRRFASRTLFFNVGGIPGSSGFDGTFWWNGPGKTAREASAHEMTAVPGLRVHEHEFRALVAGMEEPAAEPPVKKPKSRRKKRESS